MTTPDSPPPLGHHSSIPPPPSSGMSTGAKVLIGCGIAAIAFLVLLVVLFGAGAWFVDRHLSEEGAGIARQAEVTRTLEALETEVDFEPPPGGVVGDDRAQRFFTATEDAWAETQGWAEELQQRSEEAEGRSGRATFGDATFALRGMGRARVVLGEALIEQRMPPSEYVWTGLALLRAHERRGLPPQESGVPPENTEIARRHETELRELARGDDAQRATRGSLFALARSLIVTEETGRRFSGWDTLQQRSR